jgi:DinB superfamily
MPRPIQGDFAVFYKGYIDLVQGDDVVQVLETSYEPLQEWLHSLENADLQFSYAPGKWTIAQLLQHVIDTERVFAYRAMCFGRGESQFLPGFDENSYAMAAPAAGRKLKGLSEELLTLRKASIILFRSLAKENVLHQKGTASGNPVTVNAIGFIMAGHVLHHINIIQERYLKS